jgi:hypothetical protein
MNLPYHAVTSVVSLFAAVMVASAQSPTGDQRLARDLQTREYWVDPSTRLMWVGKDNGKDINWSRATKYCRDLRLGGYSDWRLATIDELKGIYDSAANAPGSGAGKHGDEPLTFHVKGNLFLTGDPWSSTQRRDDRGRLIGFVWFFDFHNVRSRPDPTDHVSSKRALCVR